MHIIIQKIRTGMYKDFILSLLASAVTTAASQLITYPLLARLCTQEEYGLILTIMGIGNVIILAFGNSLNNVRLVMNAEYEEKQVEGDFLPMLSVLTLTGTVIYCIYLCNFGKNHPITVLMLTGFALVGILQSYGSVAFRIKINYFKNLMLCIWIAVGNVLGITIFYLTKQFAFWAMTFLFGQAVGLIYIYTRSDLFREKKRKTVLFWKTAKKECVLLFTTLCANLLVYLDRLLLYPLLGAEAVSIYTVSSFFGKSLAILMTPISSVLLSYYAQRDFEMTRSRFWKTNSLTLLVSAAFMGLSVILSEWVTGFLYPTIIEQAKPFLFMANLAAVVNVIGNMVSPAVLKYASTSWMAVNQIVYMILYLGLGILLSRNDGLRGFSYAALIAGVVRVLIFYIVGHFALRDSTEKKEVGLS